MSSLFILSLAMFNLSIVGVRWLHIYSIESYVNFVPNIIKSVNCQHLSMKSLTVLCVRGLVYISPSFCVVWPPIADRSSAVIVLEVGSALMIVVIRANLVSDKSSTVMFFDMCMIKAAILSSPRILECPGIPTSMYYPSGIFAFPGIRASPPCMSIVGCEGTWCPLQLLRLLDYLLGPETGL